ncbi:39S ribosomal protein L19, mitochondrial isoform X3 [Hemicordylus capensis]|uniref:39S ribosomal protein L19, mitochondrial isoform X3 n=1 Tax=Hemicordylus capensis TaxID=884348 RepID=UPI0023033BBB|nr:39S ribosomal protein L19, mitochondrial isoform X3 [Hemicordylus capensis]
MAVACRRLWELPGVPRRWFSLSVGCLNSKDGEPAKFKPPPKPVIVDESKHHVAEKRFLSPEFIPRQQRIDPLMFYVERRDMVQRRKVINIPEFYVGIQDVQRAIHLLQAHGFIINLQKTHLCPSQSLLHLGALFNTSLSSVPLPLEHRVKIASIISPLLGKSSVDLKLLAQILGSMIACLECTPWARWHSCILQWHLLPFQDIISSLARTRGYVFHSSSTSPFAGGCPRQCSRSSSDTPFSHQI